MESPRHTRTSSRRIRRSHVLVREDITIRRHTSTYRSLDPPPSRRLEGHVPVHRRRALILAAQPERLVPRPERRARSGVVRIDCDQRPRCQLKLGVALGS